MTTISQRYQKPVERLFKSELYTVKSSTGKSLLIYQSTIHQPADPKIPFKQLNQLKLNLAERISPLTTLQPQLFYYPIKSLRYAPLNQEDFCLIFQLPVLLVRIVQLFHTEKLRKSFAKDISYYSVKSKLLFYY